MQNITNSKIPDKGQHALLVDAYPKNTNQAHRFHFDIYVNKELLEKFGKVWLRKIIH